MRREGGRLTSRLLLIQAKKLLYATQSWFVIALVGSFDWLAIVQLLTQVVGAAIGVNAALISILTEWLADLKTGVCREGWWLNRQSCCTQMSDEHGVCSDWHQWSEEAAASWVIYVLFSVRYCGRCGGVGSYSSRYCLHMSPHTLSRRSPNTPPAQAFQKSSALLLVSSCEGTSAQPRLPSRASLSCVEL